MTGSRSAGVDKALVSRIQGVLNENLDKLAIHVDKPPAGSLGGSQSGTALEGLMHKATDRINSTLSETTLAVQGFVAGLDEAVRAIESADDEAESAFTRLMHESVDKINQPFFENLTKDSRINLPNLPFLNLDGLEDAMREATFKADQAAQAADQAGE